MTVLRLPGEELLLHSPTPMTPTRRDAVEALGRVTHLDAPNTFHHLWIGAWAEAFLEARVHAPAALARRSLDAVLAQDFARIVVGHGTPVTHDPNTRLAEAYAWLPAARGSAALTPSTRVLLGRPCG